MRKPVPVLLVLAVLCLMHVPARAQSITGALIGTVKDTQGAVRQGAIVRVVSPSLIGGSAPNDHQREGSVPLSRASSGRLRARNPGARIHHTARQGHQNRCRGDDRKNRDSEPRGRSGVGVRRGVRLADRSARERPRGALRPRRSSGHSGSPIQHVRLHPSDARRLCDVARQHDDQQRLGVRLGDE